MTNPLNEVLTDLERDITSMTVGQLVAHGNRLKRQRDDAKSSDNNIKDELAKVDALVKEKFLADMLNSMTGDGMTTYLQHAVNVKIVDLAQIISWAAENDAGLFALLTFNATSFSAHMKKAYLAHPDLKDQYFTDPSHIPEGLRGAVKITEATVVRRRKA